MTQNANRTARTAALEAEWASDPRWEGISRDHTAGDVVRLQGPTVVDHTIARRGAAKLWRLLAERDYVAALGALSGGQAVQMAKAGLEAIYLSGWQVAGDANTAGQVYPDQSLYPANSGPELVRRINNALLRADQIAWGEGEDADQQYATEPSTQKNFSPRRIVRASAPREPAGVVREGDIGPRQRVRCTASCACAYSWRRSSGLAPRRR